MADDGEKLLTMLKSCVSENISLAVQMREQWGWVEWYDALDALIEWMTTESDDKPSDYIMTCRGNSNPVGMYVVPKASFVRCGPWFINYIWAGARNSPFYHNYCLVFDSTPVAVLNYKTLRVQTRTRNNIKKIIKQLAIAIEKQD